MELPKAFTDDSDLGMCYEKKVIMNPNMFHSTVYPQLEIIGSLLQCMQDTNKFNNHEFPFYQLRVRPTRLYEKPSGICFELRWGDRNLLPKKDVNA